VSLADQSVLGSVESKVSEVLNMIDSEKMKTMFPSKVKKVSEMTEVEICDFVFQVCRHQSSFFSDMVWDLLQTTFSYPPLALQFSKTEYIHDFVVLLSSAFALSPSPKANRTQAFALKTIAHLSASLSRNQKELKDIGAVKYVENALRAISHGRLTMVEIEAARALYCLCFGLAGGSVANRQELTNISEINWREIIPLLIKGLNIESQENDERASIKSPPSSSAFSDLPLLSLSSASPSCSSSSPLLLCLRFVLSRKELRKLFCESLEEVLGGANERLQRLGRSVLYSELHLKPSERVLSPKTCVQLLRSEDSEVRGLLSDCFVLDETQQAQLINGIRHVGISNCIDPLLPILCEYHSEAPLNVKMVFSVLKAIASEGPWGAMSLIQNRNVMEVLKQMGSEVPNLQMNSSADFSKIHTWKIRALNLVLTVCKGVPEGKGECILKTDWLLLLLSSHFESIVSYGLQISTEIARLYPMEARKLATSEGIARLSKALQDGTSKENRNHIICLLSELFRYSKPQRVDPSFLPTDILEKLSSTIFSLLTTNLQDPQESSLLIDVFLSLQQRGEKSSPCLTGSVFEQMKEMLLTCEDQAVQIVILELFHKSNIKGNLCFSLYNTNHSATTRCTRYCGTCIWYICEVCAEICHNGHLIQMADPARPLPLLKECGCGGGKSHQFCRAQHFDLPEQPKKKGEKAKKENSPSQKKMY